MTPRRIFLLARNGDGEAHAPSELSPTSTGRGAFEDQPHERKADARTVGRRCAALTERKSARADRAGCPAIIIDGDRHGARESISADTTTRPPGRPCLIALSMRLIKTSIKRSPSMATGVGGTAATRTSMPCLAACARSHRPRG